MPKEEEKALREDLRKKIRQLSALYDVGKYVTSSLVLDEVLKLITKKAADIMDASYCSLRLLSDSKDKLVLKCAYGHNNRAFRIKKILDIEEGVAGSVVKNGIPYVSQKRPVSLVTVPLLEKNNIIGVLSIYNKKGTRYSEEDVNFLSTVAIQVAIAVENARLYKQAEWSYLNTIKTLSNIIDAKDSYTYGHSEHVREHCMNLAEELKLSEADKQILRYASLLHDIGKIGIDVGILRKPARLSSEEWKVMVMHPILGSGIVEQIGFLSELAPIILRHHERYDGKGYPGRLKKEKIPLSARILAVADAYESMVSNRPYRKALSFRKAKEELLKGAGTQFDPEIVKVFLKLIEKKKRAKQ